MHIKIGTRGSKLALWQAYHVEEILKKAGASTEILIIHTKGDKILDRSLSKIGSKGVFTVELEEQLLNGQIDIAVHSAKDLQSDLGNNFKIIAFLEREKVNDVIVSHKEINLEKGFIIGTSSTRRVAMLKAFHPHISVVDMRGNLQTRIAKMEKGDCDALLLAYAGVHRMAYNDKIKEVLSEDVFTPAVGQGSVAIESSIHLDSKKKNFIRECCNHIETETCLKAERAFLKEMNGGCSIPVFGLAKLVSKNEIELNAGIISLDGAKVIRLKNKGSDAITLGQSTGKELLSGEGNEILIGIKKELSK